MQAVVFFHWLPSVSGSGRAQTSCCVFAWFRAEDRALSICIHFCNPCHHAPAHKQTSKEARKQTNKQTNKQASHQASKQTNKYFIQCVHRSACAGWGVGIETVDARTNREVYQVLLAWSRPFGYDQVHRTHWSPFSARKWSDKLA